MPATRDPATGRMTSRTLGDDDPVIAEGDVTPTPRHAIGCPEERVERFVTKAPSGVEITVVRCIDCGEQALR